MNKNRIGALIAATALTLTFAGTAFANDLHQDPPIVGTEFNGPQDCAEGWHFVHTGAKSESLPSELTAEFKDAGVVKVAGYVNGNSIVMYNVYVDPSDTLLGASDDISNDGLLNLSHVCWTETTTTTEETTTTTDETTTTEETTTTTESTTEETTTTESTTDETTTTDSTTDETTTTDSTTDETTTTDSTTEETTTPDGSVEELTPPSTDTIAATSSSTVSTGLLLVLAGILSFALVLAPAAARKRR